MAKKQREIKKDWAPAKFYLNGEPVDKIPQYALDIMAERLSRVVSQHFREHPEEYAAFLAWQNKKKAEQSV